MKLKELDGDYSIIRYQSDQPFPSWVLEVPGFCSVTKTDEEISILCETRFIEATVHDREDGWRGFRVIGQLPFTAVGVLASIAAPLADAEISILAIATFETDYFFVRQTDFERAKVVLESEEFFFE